ncbi:MAG: hypothetical protein K9N46_13345 [Candidatus Marinimicrobia bacterium]|nr:hypothetical protein [Candidatus Neomarinimicrobiota bacterium]MCF7829767.1 hypothetical protein [Candidatus Neomarinimicrobiota bacterium]MCF7881717.1 hypothetical protein [Candidatus Neomarinimicrobiota bacterium]
MEWITDHWLLLSIPAVILGTTYFVYSRKYNHDRDDHPGVSQEYEVAGIIVRHVSHESGNYNAGCCCSPAKEPGECKMK